MDGVSDLDLRGRYNVSTGYAIMAAGVSDLDLRGRYNKVTPSARDLRGVSDLDLRGNPGTGSGFEI